MSRFTTLLILVIAVAVVVPQSLNAQTEKLPPRTIGFNPIGAIFDGLSFLEYTHPIAPRVSFVARLDFVNWSEDESEFEGYNDVYTNEYKESGKGPGAGIGIRYYLPLSKSVNFEISSGIDVLSVGWEWEERQYGKDGTLSYAPDSGDGTTTAFAYHFGFGTKINIGARQKFFIEPQVLFGSMALDVEHSNGAELSGVGFFYGGAVVLGINM